MPESAAEIVELRGTLRDYAWGSRDFISRWLGFDPRTRSDGVTRASAGPEAEWWLGAHAASPSMVRVESGWKPLPEWIAEDASGRLGRASFESFGSQLPFLFKILAADRPLSLQAHPDAEQARAGYAREEAAGIPRDSPARNYRDANPKPELLCALTPFDALVGFRSSREILKDLDSVAPNALRARLEPLRTHGNDGLRACFSALWNEAADAWFEPFVDACRRRSACAVDALVVELAGAYPGDVGVLAPMLLHHVHLEPGEAIYLPARELHSYVRGAGLELMGNSDNVLRGGLTPKHIDVAELLTVLDFPGGREGGVSAPARVERVERAPGEIVYRTPAASFELTRLDVRGNHVASNRRGFSIVLCESGSGNIRAVGESIGLKLSRGMACAVSARVPAVEISGDLTLHRAALPQP